MIKVGSREMKNRFGRYLARAKRGETIVVTLRGEPIAKLAPAEPVTAPVHSSEELLDRLESEGMIQRGRKPFQDHRPVKAKGKPASRMILEDRR